MNTPNPVQQSVPQDMEGIRDRIAHAFHLLGIRSLVQVTTFAMNESIAVSPLSVADAAKLAEVLDSAAEER